MTKKQRLMELVHIILDERKVVGDELLTCADCLMALPDRHIPDELSLRHFAHDILDLFFGRCDRCNLHHPKAAKWVRKWRKVWYPRPAGTSGVADAAWTTDSRLKYRSLTGPATEGRDDLQERFVGRTAYEALGEYDPDHKLLAIHEAALRGETRAAHGHIGDNYWYVTASPRMHRGRVVGVDGTAVRLPDADVVGLLDAADAGTPMYSLLDRDLTYLSVTGDGLVELGLTETQVVGRPAPDVWGSGDHPAPAGMRRALAGETAEGVFEFADRQVRFLYMPRYDPDGLVLVGVAGVVVVGPPPGPMPDWLDRYGGGRVGESPREGLA
jgi:hypothetical protein